MLAGQAMKPEFEFSEPTLKSDIDISMCSPRVSLLGHLKPRQKSRQKLWTSYYGVLRTEQIQTI